MGAVPGLNGTHRWNDLVTLNDVSVFPRVRLRRIPGLHTLPEREDVRDLPVGRDGEIPRDSARRGKSVVYEGLVEAQNQTDLDDFRETLLEMFGDGTAEGRMVIAPRSPFVGPTYFYNAAVMALDIPEEHPASARRISYGFERPFTLGLRMSNARFYKEPAKTDTTAAITPSSGTSLPFILPVSLTPPDEASGTVIVENEGSAPTDFVVDLHGPSTNPFFANDTIGKRIRLPFEIPVNNFVRIDFRQRSVLLNGIDRVGYDREATTWWDRGSVGLRRGTNALRYGGDTIQDPAFAEITFNDAQWG
jgi:hypothetical protein